MNYLAIAPLKSYLFGALVWAIILAVLIPSILALFKRKQIFIFIVGVLLTIGAIPVTIMSGFSINGCCGAPSSGYEGVEYLIGVVVAIAGIAVMVFSKKLARK